MELRKQTIVDVIVIANGIAKMEDSGFDMVDCKRHIETETTNQETDSFLFFSFFFPSKLNSAWMCIGNSLLSGEFRLIYMFTWLSFLLLETMPFPLSHIHLDV